MPIIKSAIKKMRKDKVRTARNEKRENLMRRALKDAQKNPSVETIASAFSALDKAVKVNIVHKNKAARAKSQLSKLLISQ